MNTRKFASLPLLLLLALAACQAATETQEVAETPTQAESPIEHNPLVINSFKDFPPEVDGCSCYFSADSVTFKKGEYMYMNNYGKLSFVKVDGKLLKFEEVSKTENDNTTRIEAKAGGYTLKVDWQNGQQIGEEVWRKLGSLTVTDSSGRQTTQTFFGECGC